jgi:putative transcriptional regulator
MNRGDNLTGSLLVSHPALRDPNFRRTIVFLSQHSPEEGATGFVLNRPIDTVVPGEPGIPVFFGGPVDAGSLLLTSLQWRENPTIVAFRAFVDGTDDGSRRGWEDGLRVFAGYSGWSPGQLENELSQNTWLVVAPTRDLIEMKTPETSWKNIMRSAGPLLHLLAEAPDDPARN